jgi:hypothetical protein
MRSGKLTIGTLSVLLTASLIFSAALWVHREDVLSATLQGIDSAIGELQFAGYDLEQNRSATGQRNVAYMVTQAVGQLMEAAPVLGQEGYDGNAVYGFAIELLTFTGKLEAGTESKQVLERQARALAGLPSMLSPTYRKDSAEVLGRRFLNDMANVSIRFTEDGVF